MMIGHLAATAVAFLLATLVNWVLGRCWTFRNAPKRKSAAEMAAIYLVSGIGLLMNLALMLLFVDWMGWVTFPAKVTATGLVFFWNFAARRFWVYRQDAGHTPVGESEEANR